MSDLKPCPFCGEHLQLSENLSTRSTKCFVHDPNGCFVQSTTVHVSERDSVRAEAWNTRADTTELEALRRRVEELEGVLEPFAEESFYSDAHHEFVTVKRSDCDKAAAALRSLSSEGAGE